MSDTMKIKIEEFSFTFKGLEFEITKPEDGNILAEIANIKTKIQEAVESIEELSRSPIRDKSDISFKKGDRVIISLEAHQYAGKEGVVNGFMEDGKVIVDTTPDSNDAMHNYFAFPKKMLRHKS